MGKKNKNLIWIVLGIIVFGVAILLMVPNPIINKCTDYTYSTCPNFCEAICVPSSCDPVTNTCTTDCEGIGSCFLPISRDVLCWELPNAAAECTSIPCPANCQTIDSCYIQLGDCLQAKS